MSAAILFGVFQLIAGCGSGSAPNSTAGTTTARQEPPPSAPLQERSPGVGWTAPISRTVGPRHRAGGAGRLPGSEGTGAKGCQVEEGRGEIGVFTDVPQPSCVRVTGQEPVLVVNRTGAYHRPEGHPITVRLGPYRAHLLPQQAFRLAPTGRFLARGYHQVKIATGRGGVGILVLPRDCAIRRPEPGEALCFAGERAGRLRRWRRTEVRMGAPACVGSDLTISAERHYSIGAGGTIYTKLFITNRSPRPCTVAGVPKVVGIERGSKAVQVAEPRPNLRPVPSGRRRRVKIAPGRSATFLVAHYDGIGAGRCRSTSTYGLRVAIPGTGPRQVVRSPMGYCPAPGAGLGLMVGRIE
jgi:hypothetical protein